MSLQTYYKRLTNHIEPGPDERRELLKQRMLPLAIRHFVESGVGADALKGAYIETTGGLDEADFGRLKAAAGEMRALFLEAGSEQRRSELQRQIAKREEIISVHKQELRQLEDKLLRPDAEPQLISAIFRMREEIREAETAGELADLREKLIEEQKLGKSLRQRIHSLLTKEPRLRGDACPEQLRQLGSPRLGSNYESAAANLTEIYRQQRIERAAG